MNFKKTLLVILVASVFIFIAAYFSVFSQKAQVQKESQPVESSRQALPSTSEISYEGIEGQRALDILKGSHLVETKNFAGVGEYVSAIDGTYSDGGHFWAFYVNTKQADVGAGDYITKDGDVIVWKLEEIKQ